MPETCRCLAKGGGATPNQGGTAGSYRLVLGCIHQLGRACSRFRKGAAVWRETCFPCGARCASWRGVAGTAASRWYSSFLPTALRLSRPCAGCARPWVRACSPHRAARHPAPAVIRYAIMAPFKRYGEMGHPWRIGARRIRASGAVGAPVSAIMAHRAAARARASGRVPPDPPARRGLDAPALGKPMPESVRHSI